MGVSRVAITSGRTIEPGQALTRVVVSQGGAGATTLKSAQLGKSHKVIQAVLTLDTDGTLKFSDSTPADLSGPLDVGAKGGFVYESDSPLYQAAENKDLILTTTGGAAHGAVLVLSE